MNLKIRDENEQQNLFFKIGIFNACVIGTNFYIPTNYLILFTFIKAIGNSLDYNYFKAHSKRAVAKV